MERVAFLIEETNERLRCLLNPESLVIRRTAGVRSRRSLGGPLTGTGLTDDPLVYTGGGRTELQLDLLFDVALAGSSITSDDVRELTSPLWNLAENSARNKNFRQPPQVRFLWGKAWDIPGVVVAVAERLEYFTAGGAPQRSWLRMRLLRMTDSTLTVTAAGQPDLEIPAAPTEWPATLEPPAGGWDVHEMIGGAAAGETGEAGGLVGERLDQLAFDYYGDASLWRLLAAANDIDDPFHIDSGTLLQIPTGPDTGGTP
jgi:hypothetical protein